MFEVLKLVRKHYDGTNNSINTINKEAKEVLKGLKPQKKEVA